MSWYLSVLKKYAVFSGRARRKEYWMFTLFNTIFLLVILAIDYAIGTYPIFYCIYAFALILPSIGVTIRRLHDIDKSGWFIFVSLIPFIGSIWLLILICTEGNTGINGYGQDPKEVEE